MRLSQLWELAVLALAGPGTPVGELGAGLELARHFEEELKRHLSGSAPTLSNA